MRFALREKCLLVSALCILAGGIAFADNAILGKYYIENAVDDYQGTRYFEIVRNEYQEYMVIADNSFQSVAYYDAENHELFCVIESTHQYNTLMKFKIADGQLTVYSLINERWYSYPATYRKKR